MLAATLPAGRGTDDDGVHPPGDMVELRSDGSVPLVLLTARAGIDVRTTYVLLVPVVVEVEKAIVLTCTVGPAVTLAVAARVKGVTGAPVLSVALLGGDGGVLGGLRELGAPQAGLVVAVAGVAVAVLAARMRRGVARG